MFLVCPNINLTLCAGYLGHCSLSKSRASGAAMEKIYPFNEHNKIIFYNKTIFYNGVTKTYTRTVRVDKQWEVRNIVKKNFI